MVGLITDLYSVCRTSFFWAITRLNLSILRPPSYGILIPYLSRTYSVVPIGPHTRKVLPVVTFITNGKGNSRFVYSSMCSIFWATNRPNPLVGSNLLRTLSPDLVKNWGCCQMWLLLTNYEGNSRFVYSSSHGYVLSYHSTQSEHAKGDF